MAVVLVAIVLAGCGNRAAAGPAGPTPDPDAIEVVATTTVLADLVAQVGGTRVDVHSLVPKGGEVHTFDPTPADVERIAHADLIVRNGLGLDDWLTALVEDAGTARAGGGPGREPAGRDLPRRARAGRARPTRTSG